MSEMSHNEELQKIDLFEILGRMKKYIRSSWYVPLVLSVIFAGFFWFSAKRAYVPMYQSRAMFSVSSGYRAEDIFNSSYYDNSAAQQLATAFPYIISTQVMQDLMKEHLGTNYINGTVTCNAVAGSNMFTLTAKSSSPEDAQKILRAAIDVFPQVAVYVVDNPQLIIRDEPSFSDVPVNSFSWKLPVVRGVALGAGIYLCLLIVLAMMSGTVTSVEQLRETVNLPVLAVVPGIRIKRRRSERNQFVSTSTNPELTETMRSLSMKTRKHLQSQDKKVIMITSTLSGEGKTTVSCNLAQTMAEEGYRVVLVDADIRKQSAAERFGLEEDYANLLDCIRNPERSVLECLRSVPGSNLAILSGESVTERRYSIDPKAMRRIIQELSEYFDYIVMDTAPCAVVADTTLLCHYAGCVLYVVRPDCAWKSQIYDTVNTLYERGISTTGFVYNGANVRSSNYGYGYKYGYGYGYKYGYGYGYGNKKSR